MGNSSAKGDKLGHFLHIQNLIEGEVVKLLDHPETIWSSTKEERDRLDSQLSKNLRIEKKDPRRKLKKKNDKLLIEAVKFWKKEGLSYPAMQHVASCEGGIFRDTQTAFSGKNGIKSPKGRPLLSAKAPKTSGDRSQHCWHQQFNLNWIEALKEARKHNTNLQVGWDRLPQTRSRILFRGASFFEVQNLDAPYYALHQYMSTSSKLGAAVNFARPPAAGKDDGGVFLIIEPEVVARPGTEEYDLDIGEPTIMNGFSYGRDLDILSKVTEHKHDNEGETLFKPGSCFAVIQGDMHLEEEAKDMDGNPYKTTKKRMRDCDQLEDGSANQENCRLYNEGYRWTYLLRQKPDSECRVSERIRSQILRKRASKGLRTLVEGV